MKKAGLLLLAAMPLFSQVGVYQFIPGLPPGGIGGACPATGAVYGYLTAAGQILTCVASAWTVSGGSSGGSVTTFSATATVSPLFTTSVANPTTTPAMTITVSNAGADTFLGNPTGSSAAPIYMSATQATATLNVFTSSLNGLAPASGGGTANFLRADGAWVAPGGTGTVTTFSAGNLSPLFATSVATATSTPALSFSLSNASADTFFGNPNGTTGAPSFMSATQATAALNVFTSSLNGLAPLSGGGTSNFLRADGTWAAPSGGGGGASLTTGPFVLTKTSATVLTFDSASGTYPSIWPGFTTSYTFTTPTTITVSGTASTGSIHLCFSPWTGLLSVYSSLAATITLQGGGELGGPFAGSSCPYQELWTPTMTVANTWDAIAASMDHRGQGGGPVQVTGDGTSIAVSGTGVISYIGTGGGGVSSVTGTTPIVSSGGSTPAISCATCGVTGSSLSQFASTTSAQLAGVLSDETGTSLAVFNTSPLLVTPKVTTITDANGNPFLISSATASAVDSVTVTNAATANPATVTVGATGSDSNINLSLVGKGTGGVQFPNGIATGSSPPAVTPGTGGLLAPAEGTAPSAGCSTPNVACIYADSSHTLQYSRNGSATFFPLVAGPTISTSGHLAAWSNTTGSALSDLTAVLIANGGTNATSAVAGSIPQATSTSASSWTPTPVLGVASTSTGTLGMNNSGSAFTLTLASSASQSATYTFIYPTTAGTVNYLLTTNGSGVTSWTGSPTATVAARQAGPVRRP